MSYSHLSIIERGQLETLHRLGWSCRAIGLELGRHPSTIARELKRGSDNEGTPLNPLSKRLMSEERHACLLESTHPSLQMKST